MSVGGTERYKQLQRDADGCREVQRGAEGCRGVWRGCGVMQRGAEGRGGEQGVRSGTKGCRGVWRGKEGRGGGEWLQFSNEIVLSGELKNLQLG